VYAAFSVANVSITCRST